MIIKLYKSTAVKRASIFFMLLLQLLTQVYAVSANSPDDFFKPLSAVPSKPTLISPDGQAEVNPTYRWTPAEGAVDYAVFVGAEDESEPPKINGYYTVECATECSLSLPDKQLTSGKTYIWWVAGRNAEGLGEFSDTKTFLTVPPPDTVVLLSPKSTEPQSTYTPTYRWEEGENIDQYRLVVSDLSAQNIVDLWYDASSICAEGVCEVTPSTELIAGQYNWWVIAKNSFGESEMGDSESFEVLLQPPSAVGDLINPSEFSTPTPQFSWGSVSSATEYKLVVISDQSGQTVIDQVFTDQQLGCSDGSAICSTQWGESLAIGIYHWTVQTKNNSSMDIGYGVGYGPPSYSEDFEVPPAPSKPTLISPSGDIATANPDFQWDHQALATSYFISIRKGTQTVFEDWYQLTDAELSCDQLTCTLTPPINLDASFYTWSIQAAGYGGTGPASDELDFTVTQMTLKAVAISNEGELAEGNAYAPSISENGEIIAFYSYASNIVPGCGDPTPNKDHEHPENYKADIFVYDRSTNPPTITCVSKNDDGQVGNDSSINPIVSSNGQYITFASKATNFVWHESMQSWIGDANEKMDVFVYDRNTSQTKLISLATNGSQSNGDSIKGMVTPDGKYAVFTSTGSYLTETSDNNGTSDVFLRNLVDETTVLVSKNFLNTNSGNGPSEGWQISDDGRFISYQSWANNLTPQDDENFASDIFVWDNGTTLPVSVASDNLSMGNKASFGPSMPSNGAYIAYYTSANNIVAGCGDQAETPTPDSDVILYTIDGSVPSSCIRSSATDLVAFGANAYNTPSLSRNGRVLAFESESSLVEEDTNDKKDIYYYDLAEETLHLVSQTIEGTAANDESSFPVVSGTGVNIALESKATNIVDGAVYQNIYLTDLAGMINYGPPRNLSASEIGSSQVKLSWNASVDAEFIDGYRIYQNNAAVATTPEIETVISNLECGTDYNFKVRAYADNQESIPSNTVIITTSNCPSNNGFNPSSLWSSDFGSSNFAWDPTKHYRTVGDVNGDGYIDIVGFHDSGTQIALATGAEIGFGEAQQWLDNFGYNQGWKPAVHIRLVGDVNGDNYDDIVGFGDPGTYVALSTGSKFQAVSRWLDNYGTRQGWYAATHTRVLGDINGDGKKDMVGFGDRGVLVALSTGTTFDPISIRYSDFGTIQNWSAAKHVRVSADVNGDGKDDLIGFGDEEVKVLLSTGTGFEPISVWTSDFSNASGWSNEKHVRTVADVNGDGMADIVGFYEDGVYVALSNGSSFGTTTLWSNEFGYDQGWRVENRSRTVGDANGDGKSDLVGFNNNGTWISTVK